MEASNCTDIHTKYQKVASEYSKSRAQISVLKKAILDEQSKLNELKDVMKNRDQTIRKYEQEIDSLTFRNQQLAKRVTVLQDELEATQIKQKKNKNKSDPNASVSVSNNLIFNEELQSKIEENARLHQLLAETKETHQATVDELRLRLESVEKDSHCSEQALLEINKQHKVVTDKLQQNKVQLEIRFQAQEKELKELRIKAEESEQHLRIVQSELGQKFQYATSVIKEHLPFNDTEKSELNALNIPTHDRKYQKLLQELISHVAVLVRDLVSSLSNFHTYTEQRVQIYAEEIHEDELKQHVHKKYAQLLHENATYLRPIEHSFLAFQRSLQEDGFLTLETAVGLRNFADKFARYCAYLNKLLPYQLLSIESECSLSSCTTTLEAKNKQLHASHSRLTTVFNKINTYITALAAQSDCTQSHPRSSQEQLLLLLVHSCQDLQDVVKEASVHYNARVSLEHQLPTSTHKLRSTDECVLSSMISMVTCTSKLASLLKSKLSLIMKDVGSSARNTAIGTLKTSPAVARFKQRAANYVYSLQTEPCKSVPYHEALRNQEILLSSTESRESLARQLATSQEKISKLEQAKEHWMLEFQLLQIKHEKDIKKLQKLEEQVRGGGDALSTISSGSSTDEVSLPTFSTADQGMSPGGISMLGKLEALNSIPTQGDNRENEIKSYFTQHIKDLLSQMQMADSKAVAYHAELITLQRRLQLAEQSRAQMNDQLATSNATIDQLKEELSMTTKSYEGQLNMMSEHLANMNDKLTSQKDEIDALKYNMNNVGSKKQRGK